MENPVNKWRFLAGKTIYNDMFFLVSSPNCDETKKNMSL